MQQALDGFSHKRVCSLQSPASLALKGWTGLFSGTGEQASGRVDVPGKDNQQHAAAAIETVCFFVKSLGGASYVVKFEHHATVARVKQHVALKSGVREDAFYLVWEASGW